ncbi:MAG: hypothetical protein ABI647_17075 [Gemmatimonadota bacterium]
MIPLPRSRRFTLLAGLAALGAVLFVPFLQASAPGQLSTGFAVAFVGVATGVAALATWFGLAWADGAGLPMPLLRAFETRTAAPRMGRPIGWAVRGGAAFGIAGIAALRIAHIPGGSGSLPVKIGSALFAAVTLESVLHLAIMSGVVRATGRIWAGIAAATVAFILFHLSTLGGQPASVVALATIANGLGGLLFGLLYARHGFESLVVAHLIAHAITVGFA